MLSGKFFGHGVVAILLALLAGTGARATAQEAAAEAETAFDAAYEAFSAAYRAGDPEAVTALYGADAFYLAPGGEIARGNVVRHFEWLSSFEPGAGPLVEFEIVDREVSGGLAYDIGYYSIRRPDAPAGSASRGKFIVIWKRDEDGAWRIHADGFSDVRGPDAPTREGQ